ncbi:MULTISPECIES: type II CRISPR RNA-guided endonuclease Cas9 [Bartonella]|uniref:type II CRISPR RNA-guided endonuclease Cas9 n=3 Tax=Bartonellaceae TaxID=772 RepID=UPI001AEF22D5|nr:MULTISPECIES: type II CRISPR RNA-guided endonuclease Cas9 [Bartonella]MBH9993890.1 type II CRISPR RNA-guided endonuclease Cas9 [Bartonella sp. P0291]MBH9997765.1 type II CRISPR RNA-guided endonuclease Cas9 [Bartonella sp. M0192]MBH9999924.1 type II CRISPR RNA-guided endonuclease Cas9 [Bartonella sp. M0191]MBI0011216.1 type II CRISPR RNA-guided endonuclease Cas9 [Bartonella sp. M0176]MBI0011663.1 type II CRISPR RNA-guided endonuclease Cas9 [Bartonella apihabitans]
MTAENYSNVRFSFDIGTNSIGWAVFQLNNKQEAVKILNAGARIFSDGRDPQSGDPLAVRRRTVRSASRMRDRYLRRRKRTLDKLIGYGLLPEDKAARDKILLETNDKPSGSRDKKTDPYSLRARALEEKLPLAYVARALFHIGQRRGFKSNRKADRKSNEKGKIAVGIEELSGLMHQSHASTLGAYLAKRRDEGHVVRLRANSEALTDKAYAFYPERSMLEDEFRKIWQAQAEYYPDVLTKEREEELFHVMFFQRPLKEQKVGFCTLVEGELRLPKSDPLFQQFRLYKEINELAIILPDLSQRKLTMEERDTLITLMRPAKTKTFAALRKALKIPAGGRFNKETENRKQLTGDEVYSVFSKPELFGGDWAKFSIKQQCEVIDQLENEENPDKLEEWLKNKFSKLSDEQRAEIINANLPDGYGRFGITATSKILEQLKKDVISEAEAAHRCGFDHSLANRNWKGLDELPRYQEVLERHIVPGTGDKNDIYDIYKGRLTNPTVHIGLNQVRRLTNRLIKAYGKPWQIVVELARDLPLSQEQKRKVNKTIKNNTDAAIRRSEQLGEIGKRDNGYNRLLLKLWEELGDDPNDRKSIYSGKVIEQDQLFNGEVEIDHILPFSSTLDDSYANKILCLREENRLKSNFAPADVGKWQDHYNEILERAKILPKNKQWRFALGAMDKFEDKSEFIARQLTDTQYLAKLAREYFDSLYPGEEVNADDEFKKVQHVWAIPGKLTELLRRNWGLNELLSPAGDKSSNSPKNRKDHRHHAIDAIVIGMTTRSLLNKIAKKYGKGELDDIETILKRAFSEEFPFEDFRKAVKDAIDKIIISHKQDHGTISRAGYAQGKGKTAGQLHDATALGLTGETDDEGKKFVVTRENFLSLESTDIPKIRDKNLRAELDSAAKQSLPPDFGKMTKAQKKKEFQKVLVSFARDHKLYKGIRHVRVLDLLHVIEIKDKNGKAYKAYKGNSNYRYDVWETLDGKWNSEVISTFDAHQPKWRSQFHKNNPTARKVLSLQQNDMVAYNDPEKGYVIARIVKFGQNGQIFFAPHNEADVSGRDSDKNDPFKLTSRKASGLKKMQFRQIRVDEMGRVFDPGAQDRESKQARS